MKDEERARAMEELEAWKEKRKEADEEEEEEARRRRREAEMVSAPARKPSRAEGEKGKPPDSLPVTQYIVALHTPPVSPGF